MKKQTFGRPFDEVEITGTKNRSVSWYLGYGLLVIGAIVALYVVAVIILSL